MIRIFIIAISLLMSCSSYAHPGGLDKRGGHNDKNNGGYHCHLPDCIERFNKSDKALEEAIQEKRAFSYTYNRDDWKHWSDEDHDCMNTRHEILAAQSIEPATLSPDRCYVSKGKWLDPYSGKTFTRASDLDIDHIVPLKWAHDHGGSNWSASLKEAFANDPVNLLAVDDGLNQAKSAKGPNEWMPPNQSYRCEYLQRWTAVMNKYSDLSMTPSESRIFKKQLSACGY